MNKYISLSILTEFDFRVNLLDEKVTNFEVEHYSTFFWNLLIKVFINKDKKNSKFILDSNKLSKFPSSGRNIRDRHNHQKNL